MDVCNPGCQISDAVSVNCRVKDYKLLPKRQKNSAAAEYFRAMENVLFFRRPVSVGLGY